MFSTLCSVCLQPTKISTEVSFIRASACLLSCDSGRFASRDPTRGPTAHSLDPGDRIHLLPVTLSPGSPDLLQMVLLEESCRDSLSQFIPLAPFDLRETNHPCAMNRRSKLNCRSRGNERETSTSISGTYPQSLQGLLIPSF